DPLQRKQWEALRPYLQGGGPPSVGFVLTGLCGSWLVQPPQSWSHRNRQPRSHIADLVFAVLARVDQHLTKWIQLFHRHRELFAQQVHEARHTRRTPCHHDALDILAARGRTEEVEGFLNFERQYI